MSSVLHCREHKPNILFQCVDPAMNHRGLCAAKNKASVIYHHLLLARHCVMDKWLMERDVRGDGCNVSKRDTKRIAVDLFRGHLRVTSQFYSFCSMRFFQWKWSIPYFCCACSARSDLCHHFNDISLSRLFTYLYLLQKDRLMYFGSMEVEILMVVRWRWPFLYQL